MSSVRLLVLLCAASLLVFGACGGDDKSSDSPTATVAATDEPVPTGASTSEPTAVSFARTYDAYHYRIDLAVDIEDPMTDEPAQIAGTIEGDFEAPNSHSFTQNYTIGGISVTEEAILIGDDAWYREGNVGDWTATTATDPAVTDMLSLTSADEGFIDDPEFANDIAALDSEAETVNGVETRRYHIPSDAIDDLGVLFGEDFFASASGITEFDLTAWIGEDLNGLVRGELTATGTPEIFGAGSPFDVSPNSIVTIRMTINVTQINDESIAIGAPN